MRKITSMSLFAGGGGMTLGLEEVGFKTLFATDIERSSALTFKRNKSEIPFFLGDIRHLDKITLLKYIEGKKIDLITGGPPCQGFSTLGDQNPADPRNGLFWCFAKVVEWVQPPCFLMENVNYLRTQYGGRFEREIIKVFERLGYKVWVTTLNAADFGVPQNRKRVFFFGSKIPNLFEWPLPTHGQDKIPYENVGDAIFDLLKERLDVENHSFLKHSPKVIERYKLIPEGGRMPPPSELPEEIRRKNFGNTYKRLHRNKPSLTLVPGNNAFPVHPTENRSLSPREAARIQTFPDSYTFSGNRAEQCKLVGNAVPVRLAYHLGVSIKSHILGDKFMESIETLKPRTPSEVIEVTRKIKSKSDISAVSLFTGIGGLMLGFINAGVNVLASYDAKNSVAKNAEVNFPEVNHYKRDITELSVDDINNDIDNRQVDIVFGGPPCQGFSIMGRRRFINTQSHKPDEDERNDLTIKYIDLAIKLNPKIIFFENVKGFLSTQKGNSNYLDLIENQLKNAGYSVEFKIINSADYGIPQQRERFILIAWKVGLNFQWPESKYFANPKSWQRRYMTVGDVITDLMPEETEGNDFSHVPMKHKELVVERYKLIPEGGRLPESGLPEHLKKGYRTENVKNYSHVYKRLSMGNPATTMVPGHNAFPIHPILHRALTVREAARIQTFPDWMRFSGTRQQQCTLVGNAVPPLLAEIFSINIVKTIKGNYKSEGYKRDVYDLAASK